MERLLYLLTGLFCMASFGQLTAGDTNPPDLVGGYIDDYQVITVHFRQPLRPLPARSKFQVRDHLGQTIKIKAIQQGQSEYIVQLTLVEKIQIKRDYFVHFRNQQRHLIMNHIWQRPELFNPDIELGARYSPTATTFRLFAPRATMVELLIYENPTLTPGETSRTFALEEKTGGVWETTVPGDWAGKYYTFRLQSVAADCHPELEIVDPYAKVVTRGDGQALVPRAGFQQTIGRGLIVNPATTGDVADLPPDGFDISQAIIYETHLRDFTRDPNSGVTAENKGLYLGAAESGTHFKSLATGLDHLSELGVTVVQFHPLNEFWVMDEQTYRHQYIHYLTEGGDWHAREYYNWGYAPLNYFSPEGWYSRNPNDQTRILELKQLVSALHQRGIRVTVDVVFNHTFEGSREHFAHWLFRGIDTEYYYRTQPDGQFHDGIFCGNELKTENPMVAKYILDCLKYWTTAFKIDGFRFDWMSALDPQTLAQMVKELRALNPDLLLYGELWTLRGLSYQGKNTGTYVDRQHIGWFEQDFKLSPGAIAGFNDYFRDAVKGSGFQRDYAGGYIQNVLTETCYHHRPYELIPQVIRGMVDFSPKSGDQTEWQALQSPLNSINYIDCHDGYTLFDKLILAAYCDYQEPGQPGAFQKTYPRSATNPQVVDFTDRSQFKAAEIGSQLQQMNKLGAAILFTSQGIPFFHSGSEFLRQKIALQADAQSPSGKYYQFDVNSNTSPDAVNAIRWELKARHYEIFQYYQGLIRLRREHPTFRRTTAASVRQGLKIEAAWNPPTSPACIAYQLVDPADELAGESWKRVIVLMNPYPTAQTFSIPAGAWPIVVNEKQAGVETLGLSAGGAITVAPISMLILHE
ncbi:hypothetical protein L0128_10405 [candidate division KSB1 bacterium]|nr:hypothetical protein [candidate division KSB1 bacterium]